MAVGSHTEAGTTWYRLSTSELCVMTRDDIIITQMLYRLDMTHLTAQYLYISSIYEVGSSGVVASLKYDSVFIS